MSFFGRRGKRRGKNKPRSRSRNFLSATHQSLLIEPLEQRYVLSVSLDAITGPDTGGTFDVPSGKDLYVPLTGTDTGQTISYSASSSDPNVHVSVLTGNPTLSMTVTGTDSSNNPFSGTITMQLFQNLAPNTVSIIENLVNTHFYDNLTFYRVVPGFVIQGGANNTKSAATFNDEFDQALSFNSPGMLAMANRGANTNTSEIFISDIGLPLSQDPTYLNYGYTIFGQLTSGFEFYNDIMNAQGVTASNSAPTSPVTITSASIITDTQNGVVQISEPNNYSGTPTITVTATGSDTTTAQRTFTLTAAPPTTPTNSAPLLLGPIADQTTFENTPVSFQITAAQLASDTLSFSVTGTNGFTGTPANVTVQVTPGAAGTATVMLTPAAGFTGKINLLAHVDDTTSSSRHDALAFSLNVTSPIALTSVTNPITIANAANTTASGTGKSGDVISVVASDGVHSTTAQTTSVDAGGTWTVSGIDVSALADGTITYTASTTDPTSGAVNVTLTSTKTTVAITSLTDPIGAAKASNTTISGTGQAGATISVVASDGTNSTTAQTTTVAAGGTWSISGIDVSALADGTITYTATASDGANNSVHTSKTASKDTVAPAAAITTVTDPVNIANVGNATASGTAEVGATISLVVTDGTNSTTAQTVTVGAAGTWSIGSINLSALVDGTITYTATATDAAGNPTVVSKTALKDTVAPAIAISTVTDPITIANLKSAAASGTGEVGASISLIVTDGTPSTTAQTTTVAADGTWSISAIDASSLTDGTVTFKVTATDAANNSAQATKTATKNTVILTTVSSPINAANAANTTASGTGEVGATISLVVTDGTHSTSALQTTVANDGTWSIGNIDVSALSDGTITYTATASDTSQNTAVSSKTATKDTVAPALAIATVTSPINIANVANTSIAGSGEAAATISVVASDGTNSTSAQTTTISANGTWSVSGINVSTLTDGTITYTVTATDAANNTTTATKTTTKDTVAPTVAITTVTDPINVTNVANATASGTGEVGATVSVVASDGTHTSTAQTGTIGAGGTWTVSGIDTSALNDGLLTFTVTATDTAGNTSTSNKTATKTTVVVTLVTSPVNSINASNTSASGTGQVGATISVVASDGTHSSTAQTTTVGAGGTWSLSGINVSSLNDGTITYTATATSGASGSATNSKTTSKDTAAPAVAITSVTDPINTTNVSNTTASGTAEVGATISIVASDGTHTTTAQTATVGAVGTWSTSGINVTALNDGTITYTVTATDTAGNTATTSKTATKAALNTASLSGFVYVDAGNSHTKSDGAPALAGVVLTLRGVDSQNNPIPSQTATTASDGSFQFTALPAGTYSITEDQPGQLADGTATAGTLGGSAAIDAISNIAVTTGATGTGYYFSEAGLPASKISMRLFLASAPTVQQTLSNLTNTAPPVVTSISKADADPNTTTSVHFTVTFSEAVSGVDASDFSTVPGAGITSATIASVTGSGTTYTVAVNIAGTGTVGLNLNDNDSIVDSTGNPLGGTGTGNDNFVGPSYTITSAIAPVAITSVTNPINKATVNSTTASGTGPAGATVSLVVTDGTHTTAAQTTTIAAGGAWSISGINVTSLNDGTITYQVTATDSANHSTTGSLTSTKDTVVPVVEFLTATSPINQGNQAATAVNGLGEQGASLSVVASDGTHTTAAKTSTIGTGGVWSIQNFDVSSLTDGTITYTATATDAAGNTNTATKTSTKDTVAPAVAVSSVTNPINLTNLHATSASGTGEVGAGISLVASDGTHSTTAVTTTVAANGTWSFASIDVASLNDGTITYTATATDTNGNTATASKTGIKTTVALGTVSNPVNLNNEHIAIAAGTGQAGATISLVVSDGTHSTTAKTATAAGDGTWQILGLDLSTLNDGTITYTATATDASNNTATATKTATKATVAPSVAISTVTNPINLAAVHAVTISGTGTAGTTVSVQASDGTNVFPGQAVTVASNGTWTISNIDTSSLKDGTITFTVTDLDTNNNSSTATTTSTKSTVAITSVTNPINSSNDTNTTASGTGQVGATISVQASDGTHKTTAQTTTVDAGGNWSISGIDVTTLNDGTIAYTATATDGANNSASTNKTSTKTTSP